MSVDLDHALTAPELCARWGGNVSMGTLAAWRLSGRGPRWFKLGGKTSRALYRLGDVIAYENEKMKGKK